MFRRIERSYDHLAQGWLENTIHELQERALSDAVLSDHKKECTRFNDEGQSVENLVILLIMEAHIVELDIHSKPSAFATNSR